ncbi:hypothetical protein FRX31_025102, partial [Thalictrum thalictroides]
VMTETDQCYCVILNAHDGAAFPTDSEATTCNFSKTSDSVDSDIRRLKTSKVCIALLMQLFFFSS